MRMAFTSGKLTPYDKKKYVWKLVYINMMGYDVDFGHMEMISLVSAGSYSEKLVGYMSVAVMLRNTDPQITLVVQAIKSDLASTQDPVQCLALCAIANIGGKELAEAVAGDVERILFSRSIFPVVRKKAALCLLRLSRINRDLLPAGEWGKKLTALLEDKNLGVVLSVVTLILGLAERDPAAYENATGHLLVWLTRLAVQKNVAEDYAYHSVACPWLQVKILRALQCFPIPATEAMRTRLNEILLHIMNKTEVTKSVNRNNAEHCVLFEAVNLIMKQGELSLPDLRAKAVAHLSKFINIREPNIRYLGLEMMSRMTAMEGTGDAIRKQQGTVFFSLKDADVSIRRRALDLLFHMCNRDAAAPIVKELLSILAVSDWQIKDEMVLKIAILAERFAPDLRWYVDTILQLINIAGDHVADDVWHRLVQIVTNTETLQKYAASRAYHSLEPVTAHETAVKVGGYILGEFGYLLNDADEDGGPAIAGAQQFAAIHQHFMKCSVNTKCILLSTYCKMQNLYTELRPAILPIFEAHTTVIDAELQQRALEYLHVPELPESVTATVLEVMPRFPERENVLETKLKKAQEEKQDKDAWGVEDKSDAPAGDGEDGDGSAGGAGDGSRRGSKASADGGGAAAAAGGGAPAPAASDDLLGLGGDPAPAPAAVDPLSVPVTKRVTVDSPDRVTALHAALLSKPSGVLYEDASVQIGVKHAYAGAAGTVTLFIGNRTAVPLVALKVRVPESTAVRATVGDIPASVAPRAQVQVAIAVEALTPFTEAPALQVSFISEPGTGHAYALRLPVSVPHFCEGVAMPGADFRTRWGALAGAPREVTAIIKPSSGGGAVTVAAAAQGLEAARMSAVDAGAPGATGASTFRTKTLSPSGAPVSVGCLAMAIPSPGDGAFKVAVRTQHPDVSASVMAAIHRALSAM